MKRKFLLYILLIIISAPVWSQQLAAGNPDFLKYQNNKWVDSVMTTLSPDERIAQLIMVAAFSNRGEEHKKEILELVEEQKVGGLLFFQGDPEAQVKLMNEYQRAANVPLLGAIDAEWGLGMRLDNTISYPYQMALGAIQDEELIYKMGMEIARQIKRVGLHLNFAPVVDVNNNPENPVINYRSFGENKYNVAQKGVAYMKGLQDGRVLATAKHFPGHGDTDTDSHYGLPQINHPFPRLDSLELYPFRELIRAGVGGMMVAHLDIPALDSTGVASTLSKPIITGLLKQRLEFKGLIVTDAMNMKGVTLGNLPGVVDKDAILAGNDMLEYSEDVPKAIEEVRTAINAGLITQEEINDRCRRILAIKQWVGMDDYRPSKSTNILKELNTRKAKDLNEDLAKASLTVLKNENMLLPLQQKKRKIASISIGVEEESFFQKNLKENYELENFQLSEEADEEEVKDILRKLANFEVLLVAIHDTQSRPRNNINFSEDVEELILQLASRENTIFSLFKNPYVIDKIEGIENADGLILAYQDSEAAQRMAAGFIAGNSMASGRLPVSIGNKFKAGDGFTIRNVPALLRLYRNFLLF
ncbi:glycoside hydrolase family 3 N-terminal domain-containing protein [Salegentibacter sp. F188]|uniref:beta-N-acetylhexosaminidase n=1 Tax=Autumnicola patrickiae TaxID=3075591 RepID=A0ABU3E3E5_9FLAO|nr:glycoside hydrolase family 3 N-terminal domain-containing protein [Salegentibacter sp. F188]MDT0690433.1 glycoside hydrolase family 3 N-terminal domain-containing protein [Salegentibacter sp. F188]